MASVTAFTGSVPQHYDAYLGPLFFEPYALDLAARLPNGRHHRLLELACGTGRLTRYLLPKLAPGGRLLATDLNEAMLALARQRLSDERIAWQVVDAHSIPCEDSRFDGIVCQFGVMFFSDKPAAFKEIIRVLKPGERFYFNTWDHMRYNVLTEEARRVMDEIFPDDPAPFLNTGPYSFWEKEKIERVVTEAGFVGLQMETVRLAGTASSADDCVRGIVEGTPINGYLQERGVSVEDVEKRIKRSLENHRSGSVYVLPMQAHACSAVKP